MDEPTRTCRSCGSAALATVLELGPQPFATVFPSADEATPSEDRWPLTAVVCTDCWLLQLGPTSAPPEPVDLATDALALLSESMRVHRQEAVDSLLDRLHLAPGSRIVEMASHGNYLTQQFESRGLPTIVLEPDPQRASRLAALGQPVVHAGLGRAGARELLDVQGAADLVVDDYSLSHYPSLDDAIAGLEMLLAAGGSVSIEIDHALSIVADLQFDAIRHGHYTYLSLLALEPVLARHGLAIEDASWSPIYGGAVDLLIKRADDLDTTYREHVDALKGLEREAGLDRLDTYRRFADRLQTLRAELREFLATAHANGELVVGYGAPSRAVTLLQFCGVTSELLACTVDRSPAKQGRLLPGSDIRIESPEIIGEIQPRYVLVLAWSFAEEVMKQLRGIHRWGGQFVLPIPHLSIIDPSSRPDNPEG